MKKLMIAAAVACAAVALQAATINWTETADAIYDTTANQDPVVGANVYLILSATIGQDALVTAMTKSGYETTVAGYAVADTTTSADGTIEGYELTSAEGKSFTDGDSAYFVLFDNGNMYVSEESDIIYDDMSKAYNIDFGTQVGSLNDVEDSAGGYIGQNYYAPAEDVPEPFSGVLALVGMGAIALRRKMKKAKRA